MNIKQTTGKGRKPHPLKGIAQPFNTRLYPIDRSYLEFKHGTVTQALEHLCQGWEYETYLRQQVDKLTK